MVVTMGVTGLATAMSDSLWGVSTSLSVGDPFQRRKSLLWLTRCLIQYDRVATQDVRGALYHRNYGQEVK